jgi:phospho-N-acetylmuramoyl-pentapeptide-transferase
MLLELFNWLAGINPDFNVFAYITLRGILGALTALALSLLLGPAFIRRLV